MRYLLTTIALFSAGLAATAASAAAADQVTYIPKEKVSAAMTKPGVLTKGSNYTVIMSRREKGGQSEVHAQDTDTFYVIEGSATFVTGGTVEGEKTTGPGEIRGSGISGGQSRTLSKGDIIVIPKGTPHWFKEVPKLVIYYVVKAR